MLIHTVLDQSDLRDIRVWMFNNIPVTLMHVHELFYYQSKWIYPCSLFCEQGYINNEIKYIAIGFRMQFATQLKNGLIQIL